MNEKSQQTLLRERAGFHVFEARTQVELTGTDRQRFLHGLCTNDISALNPGDGCEAFLTNVQGKVLGYAYVFCTSESLVIDTVAGQSETILACLDRYLIREDVQFHDRSNEWRDVLVAGGDSAGALQKLLDLEGLPSGMGHRKASWDGVPAFLRAVPFVGHEGYFLCCPRDAIHRYQDMLLESGFQESGASAVDQVRIEAGTPLFGVDVSGDNLPQEVNRTAQAVSFTKGCYLGQETIARLDALGHVNRLLVGLRFESDTVPSPGSVIQKDEKAIARVTSSCWSDVLNAPLALAYVRRAYMETGTRFESHFGEVEVLALPLGGN